MKRLCNSKYDEEDSRTASSLPEEGRSKTSVPHGGSVSSVGSNNNDATTSGESVGREQEPSLLSNETSTDSDDDGGGLVVNERSMLPSTTIGGGGSQGHSITSPGPASSSRISMSGKIESYDAILSSSSLPLQSLRQYFSIRKQKKINFFLTF